MKKEVRIPILGVIEESETFTGNERYFLDYYPHGEGVYLVKIGSCSRELRDVRIRNEKTPNDRIKCDFGIFPISSSAIVEEIKKEHEATLKDYIEECCVKILTSVNANRDDVRNVDEKMSVLIKQLTSDATCLKEALNSIKEDGVASGNGISEKTLLEILEIVTKKYNNMANENNKPYFILVFHENDPMPSIVSADVIAAMYPCADKKRLDITTTDGDNMGFKKVESFKIVSAEEINFNM